MLIIDTIFKSKETETRSLKQVYHLYFCELKSTHGNSSIFLHIYHAPVWFHSAVGMEVTAGLPQPKPAAAKSKPERPTAGGTGETGEDSGRMGWDVLLHVFHIWELYPTNLWLKSICADRFSFMELQIGASHFWADYILTHLNPEHLIIHRRTKALSYSSFKSSFSKHWGKLLLWKEAAVMGPLHHLQSVVVVHIPLHRQLSPVLRPQLPLPIQERRPNILFDTILYNWWFTLHGIWSSILVWSSLYWHTVHLPMQRRMFTTRRTTIRTLQRPCIVIRWWMPGFEGCVRKSHRGKSKYPKPSMSSGSREAKKEMSYASFLKSMILTRSNSFWGNEKYK